MHFHITFEVPGVAKPVIHAVVDPLEVAFIEALESPVFSLEQASEAYDEVTSGSVASSALATFLRRAYARAVINFEDESFTAFRVATFYERLEVYVVSQSAEWLALPRQVRAALDEWYFSAYCERIGNDAVPTDDVMATLEETLAHIEAQDRPIWLNPCDCRLLAGRCSKPAETCISFRNGINTMSHRGWSKPVTKEEAKEIVLKAHRRGLMQTLNGSGVCNCCSDCCYLFRAQRERGGVGVWPPSRATAVLDPSRCTLCQACVHRCPFGVWALEGGRIVATGEACRGCGLCAAACPAGALSMQTRASEAESTESTAPNLEETR